jgi:hypothetical protein
MDAEIHSGGLEYLSVAGIYIISLERVVLFWLSRFWPSVWVRVERAELHGFVWLPRSAQNSILGLCECSATELLGGHS